MLPVLLGLPARDLDRVEKLFDRQCRVGNFQDRKQVGRNDPCRCGSGKKFKRCHGSSAAIPFSFDEKRLPDKIVKQLDQFRAAELQRQQQQGLGEPIVSAEVNGWRFVAVKGQLFAGKWKTFHDFLYHYIKNVLGSDWGNAELAKPEDERNLCTRVIISRNFRACCASNPGGL